MSILRIHFWGLSIDLRLSEVGRLFWEKIEGDGTRMPRIERILADLTIWGVRGDCVNPLDSRHPYSIKTTHHFIQPLITIPIIFDNLTATFEVLQKSLY
jgi:hypothetical protein